jgi:hypothetical protein
MTTYESQYVQIFFDVGGMFSEIQDKFYLILRVQHNRVLFMTKAYVCVIHDRPSSQQLGYARWQYDLCCECCYSYVAFIQTSKGDKSMKGRKKCRKGGKR